MVDRIYTRLPAGTQKSVAPSPIRAIPDVPQVGEIDSKTTRALLLALKERVEQLYGEGAMSALTLEKAIEVGLVAPKATTEVGSGRPRAPINPGDGYRGVTWAGVHVPPEAISAVPVPGGAYALTATASFAGVYLAWKCPDRTGGQFEVWRARENDRNTATLIGAPTNTLFVDNTVEPVLNPNGTATANIYYYWVRSVVYDAFGKAAANKYGVWSNELDGGVQWTVDPNTFARITADNILAGNLKVALDLQTGGAIHSGKELVDGVPNSASGFWIDGNYFYFGSDGDGSYIRWNGSSLEIRGDIFSSRIYGGVIEGATLAGSYVFADYVVYSSALEAPTGGLYKNTYSPQDPYETRYLIRKNTLTSAALALPPFALLGNGYAGFRTGYSSNLVTAPSTAASTVLSIPHAYTYASTETHQRCKDDSLTCTITTTVPTARIRDFLSISGISQVSEYTLTINSTTYFLNMNRGVQAYRVSPAEPEWISVTEGNYRTPVDGVSPWWNNVDITVGGATATVYPIADHPAIACVIRVVTPAVRTTVNNVVTYSGVPVVTMTLDIPYTADAETVRFSHRIRLYTNRPAGSDGDIPAAGYAVSVQFSTDNT